MKWRMDLQTKMIEKEHSIFWSMSSEQLENDLRRDFDQEGNARSSSIRAGRMYVCQGFSCCLLLPVSWGPPDSCSPPGKAHQKYFTVFYLKLWRRCLTICFTPSTVILVMMRLWSGASGWWVEDTVLMTSPRMSRSTTTLSCAASSGLPTLSPSGARPAASPSACLSAPSASDTATTRVTTTTCLSPRPEEHVTVVTPVLWERVASAAGWVHQQHQY